MCTRKITLEHVCNYNMSCKRRFLSPRLLQSLAPSTTSYYTVYVATKCRTGKCATIIETNPTYFLGGWSAEGTPGKRHNLRALGAAAYAGYVHARLLACEVNACCARLRRLRVMNGSWQLSLATEQARRGIQERGNASTKLNFAKNKSYPTITGVYMNPMFYSPLPPPLGYNKGNSWPPLFANASTKTMYIGQPPRSLTDRAIVVAERTSPVIATAVSIARPKSSDSSALVIATPADGPSLGTPPAGTCRCKSIPLKNPGGNRIPSPLCCRLPPLPPTPTGDDAGFAGVAIVAARVLLSNPSWVQISCSWLRIQLSAICADSCIT